jgi:RNA polymerase sigma factor (sigma-70 family)
MIDPADHVDLARRIAGKFTRNWPAGIDRSDVESTAMYALVKAARRHPELPVDEFEAYASVCIRGACMHAYTARRRHEDDLSLDWPVNTTRHGTESMEFGDTLAGPDDVEADGTDRAMLALVRAAIPTLSWRQRPIIERYLDGLSDDEIAAEMHITRSTVRSARNEAVRTLRRRLGLPDGMSSTDRYRYALAATTAA